MVTQHDTRQRIVTTEVDLMERTHTGEPSLHDVAQAAALDEATVLQAFSDWDALLDAAYGERFLQLQVLLIVDFARDLRTCRSHHDFVALIERHLRAAFVPERAEMRAARIEILGRCRTRPEMATTVIAAARQASTMLGEALQVAQGRGWVRPGLNTEIAATWIMGQVNGRMLLELDAGRTDDERAAWDDVSIDAVTAVLVERTEPRPRRWRRRATAR